TDVVHLDRPARGGLGADAGGDVLDEQVSGGGAVVRVDVGSLQGHGLPPPGTGRASVPDRLLRGRQGSVTRSDAPRSVPTADDPDPRRWRALSVTLVAGFMTLLDVSIVAVALPSMQRSLGADPATVQWVVSG